MNLINNAKPVRLKLGKNLTKTIKRGHAWVYADALLDTPPAQPGTPAILLDKRGRKEIGRGYYDPANPIALRICTTQPGVRMDDRWAANQLRQAVQLRQGLFAPYDRTNAFRLINGAGDGLPGLVCDVYGQAAIFAPDGEGPENFYNLEAIGRWLQDALDIQYIFVKSRQSATTQQILGPELPQPVYFLENGIQFTADLLSGQKTGFFLDQRDNRQRITAFAKDKTVLNLFGYTGGFSVYAGLSGAEHVTTLDTATPALEAASQHWLLNGLPKGKHETSSLDAFDYLEQAAKSGRTWELVILDPPSFASSEKDVQQAVKAYTHLITLGAGVTTPDGILAAASCSSHIPQDLFMEIIEESISRARRKATLLGIHGQPPDHPAPLVMSELRYLKFVLMRLD